jgi:hypothetical protein
MTRRDRDDDRSHDQKPTHGDYLEQLRTEIERSDLPDEHKRTALERLEALIASPGIAELISTATKIGL